MRWTVTSREQWKLRQLEVALPWWTPPRVTVALRNGCVLVWPPSTHTHTHANPPSTLALLCVPSLLPVMRDLVLLLALLGAYHSARVVGGCMASCFSAVEWRHE
jgi:hypothetical protein